MCQTLVTIGTISFGYYIFELGSRRIAAHLRRSRLYPRATPRLAYQQDPIRESLKILGAKWTLLVLRDIGFLKLNRFGQIVRNNPGLTPRVLSLRLRTMHKEGLIERTVKKDMVTYRLTPQGEDAVYILLAFLRYGLKYHVRRESDSKSFPSIQDLMRDYRRRMDRNGVDA